MGGWSYDDLAAMPAWYFDVALKLINEEQEEIKRQRDEIR